MESRSYECTGIDRQTGRQPDSQTDRQIDRQTDRKADRQINRFTDLQTDRQPDRQTTRQTDRLIGRQTNKSVFYSLFFFIRLLVGKAFASHQSIYLSIQCTLYTIHPSLIIN